MGYLEFYLQQATELQAVGCLQVDIATGPHATKDPNPTILLVTKMPVS